MGRRFLIPRVLLSLHFPRVPPLRFWGLSRVLFSARFLPKTVKDGTSGDRALSISALPVRMPGTDSRG